MQVSLEDWTQNAQLHSQFKVLSYSLDRDGRKYVSTIEGRDLPIYATQWHPEKVRRTQCLHAYYFSLLSYSNRMEGLMYLLVRS